MTSVPPSSRPWNASEIAPARFGKYLLERRLAVGGSSEVYVARPVRGTQPAAHLVIKRLLPGLLEDPQSLGTFALEARLHRAARHPNVVEVFEAGSIDGEPFLAMEYVDGVDAYRLMRRAQAESDPIAQRIAMHIASCVLAALSCVHEAVDDNGHPLAVIHRDVTPSNIYLGANGDVKLGDFGIARLLSRTTVVPDTSPLKGKYSYLSPEQVAGEDFDHRADLFALAVVLTEMLINRPLFPGAGQLAVLLAIRDGRLDHLREHAANLPDGLAEVLEKALARDPLDRYPSANHFAQALAPFVHPDAERSRLELGTVVRRVRDQEAKSRPGQMAVLQRIHAMKQIDPAAFTPTAHVRMRDGSVVGPFAMSKLIELTATSRLQPDDEVDLHGAGFRRLGDIPELERHVPSSTTTSSGVERPDAPQFVADLSRCSMLDVFSLMLAQRETGVLFAERERGESASTRKEMYLAQAKIIHVASSEPSELFGEYLVRRGVLTRSELELALAVMPSYGGRLGDTLIGLNLVDAVQIFHAIRDQGRARITEIFTWQKGRITFYRGVSPQRVDFPLDLDLAPLMMAGVEASTSDDAVIASHKDKLRDLLLAETNVPDAMRLAAWPPEVFKVVGAAGEGRPERDIVATLTAARLITVPAAFRAIDVACAAGLLTRKPSQR